VLGRLLLAVLPVCVVLPGCSSTTTAGAVGADRSQFLFVSAEDMNRGAASAYAQTLGQAREKSALNVDPAQTVRIRRIAARLIPQTAVFRADAPRWPWEVNVLTSSEVNAWCMPGGKIAVYTGILEQLKLTDDEAAAVMGHEIAHALREHSRERASQQAASQALIGVAAAAVGLGGIGQSFAGTVAKVTFELPNSRLQETEADRMGVELAARAGFDPSAAISLWQKMGRQGGQKPPQILSTHPSDETRMADLAVYAQRVQPLYESARAPAPAGGAGVGARTAPGARTGTLTSP
jgi:predicted Zn-dependent protease